MVPGGRVMPGEAPRGLARGLQLVLAPWDESATTEGLGAREFLAFLQNDLLLRSHRVVLQF